MRNYVKNSMTYAEYLKLIDDLLREGKTTGPNQSEAMFNYGKLNRQRMKRLDTTTILTEAIRKKVHQIRRPQIWLIITEGWCGDAAQNVPVIEKIAAENALIETRYLLRDENPELMNAYLTNNTRSIPKLIALDADTLEELGTWGPRPKILMDYFYQMRESGMAKPLIMENLQRWYNSDKNQTIQREFEVLLTNWANPKKKVATS